MHVLLSEWIFAEGTLLLLVEVVVFDVGCDAVGLHVVVVGLAAVAGVGGAGLGIGAGELFAVVEEGWQRECVGGVGVEGVVGDKLVLGAYLQVVARLELPVPHVVLLHVLEGGVVVGLGVGVAIAHNLQVLLVFPQLGQHLPLQIFQHPSLLLAPLLALRPVQLVYPLLQPSAVHRRGVVVIRRIVPGDALLYLRQHGLYLALQLRLALLHALAPHEAVFVRLRLYLRPVHVLFPQAHVSLLHQHHHHL